MKTILILLILLSTMLTAQSSKKFFYYLSGDNEFDPPADSNRIVTLNRNSTFEANVTDWLGVGKTTVSISSSSPLSGTYSAVITDTNNSGSPLQKFLLVHEGNSLTVGTGSSGTRGWTGTLTDSLNTWIHKTGLNPPGGTAGAFGYGEYFEYVNLATNGETSTQMLTQTSAADNIFRATPDTAILSFWAGDNDLAGSLITADSLYKNIRSYCLGRKAVGYKVIVCTVIPRGLSFGGGADADNYESRRLQVNALLRTHYTEFASALADFDNVPEMMDYTNLTYFSSDQIHLTNAGYLALEEYIRPIYESLIYRKNYIELPPAFYYDLINGDTYTVSMDVLATPIVADTTVNKNGTFELSAYGFVNWGTPVTNERSTTQKHSGLYSRHIVGDSNGDGFTDTVRYGQLVPITDSTSFFSYRWYKLSFWHYIVSGTLGVSDAFNGINFSYISSTAGSWVNYSTYARQPIPYIIDRVIFSQSGTTAAEFYIDDYKVQIARTPDLIISVGNSEATVYHLPPVKTTITKTFVYSSGSDKNLRLQLSRAGTVKVDNIRIEK